MFITLYEYKTTFLRPERELETLIVTLSVILYFRCTYMTALQNTFWC